MIIRENNNNTNLYVYNVYNQPQLILDSYWNFTLTNET